MSNSSILGGDAIPSRPDGRDVDLLGPSDSSDTGSDVQGERGMATGPDNDGELGGLPSRQGSTTDSWGTGERGSATADDADGADIRPDRVVDDPNADVPDADAIATSDQPGERDDGDDEIEGKPGERDVEDVVDETQEPSQRREAVG